MSNAATPPGSPLPPRPTLPLSGKPVGSSPAPSFPGTAPQPSAAPSVPPAVAKPRSVLKYTLLTLGLAGIFFGLLAGGFYLGQNTRKSDQQVATEKQQAVASAVT